MGLTSDAYARQLKQLLPPGPLWDLAPSSWLSRFLQGLATELARVDARSEDVVNEWDPRTAVELLPDWERVLGLPDDATPPSTVVSTRQAACTLKYVAQGGQTAAYFVGLAARLGFTATVVETSANTWRMDVALGVSTSAYALVSSEFRAGSRAGDRITLRSIAELEGVIRRSAPAHTVLTFAYL